MPDKKITELATLPGNAQLTDIFLAVRGDVDYQLSGQQLINFVNALVNAGAVITFNNTLPANSTGKNGDVHIQPNSGTFLQRVAGTWVPQYTVPVSADGSQVIYGISDPNDLTGNDGDTYIKTDGGVFYQKQIGSWVQVFSMATGPAGPQGTPGTNGTNGTDGKTILNGTTPPSNLSTGTNGDFYLNTATKIFYGPKAGGVWPAGFSIVGTGPALKKRYAIVESDSRVIYNSSTGDLIFNLNADDKALFPYDAVYSELQASLTVEATASGVTSRKSMKTFESVILISGGAYQSVVFEGVMDITNLFLTLQ